MRTQSVKPAPFIVVHDGVNVSHPRTVTAPTIVNMCQRTQGRSKGSRGQGFGILREDHIT